MNRRGFLSFVGLSPAMYAVDKRSLWDSVKGLFRRNQIQQREYAEFDSVLRIWKPKNPRAGHFMTPAELDAVCMATLKILKDNIQVAGWNSEFGTTLAAPIRHR